MQRWLASFQSLVPLLLCFLACFFVLQLTFLFQFSPNAWFLAIFISLAYLLFGLGSIAVGSATLLHLSPPAWHGTLRNILFGLLYLGLIGTLICDQYVMITHERLDAAFFLFDWNEIWMIADPRHRLTWPMVFGLLVLLTLPFSLFRIFRNRNLSAYWVLGGFLIACLIRIIPIDSSINRLAENRFSYFVRNSVQHLIAPTTQHAVNIRAFEALEPSFYGGHEKLDPRFPLEHQHKTPSILAHYLKATTNKKPPHIKIIIVESMSSDLFGQRGKNTGNLMPFMDSLAKQSLYFPNGFSTYQRTHNVLPAVLASVPNTIDGNVFQQLPFPRHYSLFNLYQNNYFTQFYCGVPLAYLNMIGLMSHYQTDYHVNKWLPACTAHKGIVGNAWGYPDEDLFQQAQYDDSTRFKHLDKSFMSVFLTISSHDPFIYPNKQYWERVVKSKAKYIEDPKLKALVTRQAASFGTFSYVDSTLKAFFAAEAKNSTYKNTIYLITGDHGTELYTRNPLSKYNIPIVIYSPLLKRPTQSQAIVSHNDIAPTLVNYLKTAYKLPTPDTLAFVGKELCIERKFKPARSLVFTTNKLKTSDLLLNNLAWVAGSLYTLDSTFGLHKINALNRVNWVKKQLRTYQAFSQYTIVQNNLLDSAAFVHWMGNQSVFQLDRKIHYPQVKTNTLMTLLGAQKIYKKNKTIRIEVSSSLFLANRNQLKKDISLYIHSKKNRFLSEEWSIFRNIRGRIEGKFKPNHVNRVIFSLEFSPAALNCWKRGGFLYVYLRQNRPRKLKMQEVYVKFYHNQLQTKK